MGIFHPRYAFFTVVARMFSRAPTWRRAGGKIFSLVTIVLANLLVLACVLKILFPADVQLYEAFLNVVKGTVNAWRIIVNYIIEHIINSL